MMDGRRLPGLVAILLLVTLPGWSARAASSVKPQPRTHLGGKPSNILQLGQDCSVQPAVCGNPECLVCTCQPGSPSFPTCCGNPACPGSMTSCTPASGCPTYSTPNPLCPESVVPQSCVSVCGGGDNAGRGCASAADCPHIFLGPGDTCIAIPAGSPRGQGYVVPSGAALIVTDVLTSATVEVSSDDKTTDVVVPGTQHFTGGLVIPGGSHVNLTGIVAGQSTVQLIGYLAKAG